jgi:hypothetical protein
MKEIHPMHDGLRERCKQTFAQHIDDLYQDYRIETYSRGSD